MDFTLLAVHLFLFKGDLQSVCLTSVSGEFAGNSCRGGKEKTT